MDKQEIFDKVVTHLGKQKERSINTNGDCFYRGPRGLMCAVGCLIPDELYHPSIEGEGVGSSMITELLYKVGISDHICIGFLGDLQRIHDSYSCTERWKEALYILAKNNNLDDSKIFDAFS